MPMAGQSGTANIAGRNAMASPSDQIIRTQYGKGLALLSLDGGGVRGLSSLYILQRLMEQLDPDNPPKPCDHFDLIGGTSTGGLIAIMLGRLRMTVEECIEAYNDLMPSVFEKTKHVYSVRKGKIQGRFNSEALENGVKRVLGRINMNHDALLKDPASDCKTFVCVTRKTGRQTTVFSSYPTRRRLRDIYHATRIWEAARATSAATSFFDPIYILGEEYVDGAFGANSPIDEIWTEAGDIWMTDAADRLEDNISCFVSIGTGSPAFGGINESLKGIVETLKAIATDCESVVEKFRRQHRDLEGRFFRFNVPRGLEEIGLEEAKRCNEIVAATRQYLEMQASVLEIEKFEVAIQQRRRNYRICDYLRRLSMKEIAYVRDRSQSSHSHSPNSLPWITNTAIFDRWSATTCEKPLYVHWGSPSHGEDVALERTIPLADAVFSASLNSMLYCVSVDWRNYAGIDETKLNVSDTSYTEILSTPMEILVAWACLILSLEADDNKLLKRVAELPEAARSILETLASQSTVAEHSRAGFTEILVANWDRVSGQLILDSYAWLPKDSLLLLFINNLQPVNVTEHPYYGHLNMLLQECYSNFRSQSVNKSSVDTRILVHSSIPLLDDGFNHSLYLIDKMTEYKECIESLGVARMDARKDQIRPPTPGTCQWLYDHPSYGFWRAEGGLLWIRGKPGSGKSTLAKGIVAEIQPQDSSIVAGAWFYSIKLESTQRSHHVWLKTLLRSFLLRSRDDFYKHVNLYRDIRASGKVSWTQTALEEFLRQISMIQRDVKLIAVIDALDESEDGTESERSRDHLAGFLLDLVNRPQSCLRFIVTSRPYRSITHTFRNCEQIVLEQVTGHDIMTVVDEGLAWLRSSLNRTHEQSTTFDAADSPVQKRRRAKRHTSFKEASVNSKSSIAFRAFLDDEFNSMREFLLANANGVFLWVTLVLRELEQISKTPLFNVQDLKRTLLSLPSELEDLYSVIMTRLGSHGFQKTRRILDWVIGTSQFRPLTLSMLFDAIGIDEDLDPKAYLSSATDPFLTYKPVHGCDTWGRFALDVYEECGGLVDIMPSEENVKPFQEYLEEDFDDQWIVTLLHRTTLDYLMSSRCPDPLRTEKQRAETIVVNGLMTYLQVYLPIENRESFFYPCVFSGHKKKTKATKKTKECESQNQKMTYNMLENVQENLEISYYLLEKNPTDDFEFEVSEDTWNTVDKATKLTGEYLDRLFSPPDLELLTYLQERRLLRFALEVLPLHWNSKDREDLKEYQCLTDLNQTRRTNSFAWLYWLNDIPGNIFLAICEHNFTIAWGIIKCLLEFDRRTLRKAAHAIPGAVMLYCSQNGPEEYVPDTTRAFFEEIRSNDPFNLIDHSNIHEIVQRCINGGYRDLSSYLAWRWQWSESSLLKRTSETFGVSLDDRKALMLLGTYPQFSKSEAFTYTRERIPRTLGEMLTIAQALGLLNGFGGELPLLNSQRVSPILTSGNCSS